MTKIRILSLSDDELTAKSKVTSVVRSKQFNMTNLNGFSSSLIITDPVIMHRYRNRDGESVYTIIQEVASISSSIRSCCYAINCMGGSKVNSSKPANRWDSSQGN